MHHKIIFSVRPKLNIRNLPYLSNYELACTLTYCLYSTILVCESVDAGSDGGDRYALRVRKKLNMARLKNACERLARTQKHSLRSSIAHTTWKQLNGNSLGFGRWGKLMLAHSRAYSWMRRHESNQAAVRCQHRHPASGSTSLFCVWPPNAETVLLFHWIEEMFRIFWFPDCSRH